MSVRSTAFFDIRNICIGKPVSGQPGIEPDVVPRILDLFFTTKEVGKGTGLGLSVSHGIVADHGGRLHYEDAPGGGARFVVELPLDGGARADHGG